MEQIALPLVPRESAGVAVVIFRRFGVDEETLVIRRAEREGDPWSGQVSLPGGLVGPLDRSYEETARRETAEEVGIDLTLEAAIFRGYMHQLKARTRGIVVVPCVFSLAIRPAVVPNDQEVASYKWIPLKSLAKKESRSTYLFRNEEREIS